LLFLLFIFLEESGYMSRVVFLMDKNNAQIWIVWKKSVVPLFLEQPAQYQPLWRPKY
jgi:Fe2+ transport system protein B